MSGESTHNARTALAYERSTRMAIPTYDALFAIVQAYYRAQFGDKAASVLVVGAGGGQELAAWGPSNPNWTFTGVDPSQEMLEIAMHKAVALGMESRTRLIQGTIDDLPVSDAKFDAAACILVLHFIADEHAKRKLLESIQGHLKPGAPFVLVSAYGDRGDAELQGRLNVWKSLLLDGGIDPAKLDERAERILSGISWIPERQIERLLVESGFTNVARFFSTGLFGGWICHAA